MKKWRIFAASIAVTLVLGGVLAGGFFVGNHYANENYSTTQAEQNSEKHKLEEELKKAQSELQSLSETLTSLKRELTDKETYIQELEASKAELQRKYDALLSASGADAGKIDELTSEIASLQQQLESAERDKENLQSELNSKITELEDLQNALQEKESELSELNQSILALTEQLESLNQLQGEYSRLQERYERVNTQYQELQSQSTIDKKQIQNLTSSIADLNERISELEKENESLKSRLGVDPFEILSYQKLKLSDDRYLLFDSYYHYLSSFHSDFTLKILMRGMTFNLETKAHCRVLENGDVLLGAYPKLFLYKNELDELIEIEGYDYFLIDQIKEFSDKYVFVGGLSLALTTYGDTVVINIETGESKTLKDVGQTCIIGLSNKNIVFTGYPDKLSQWSATACYMFDLDKFEFVKISTEGNAPWSDSASHSLSLKNGDILFEWGSSNLYLFSLKDKAIKEILNGKYMRLRIQSESNGKVTIKDDDSSDIYEYDINSQTVTKKQL